MNKQNNTYVVYNFFDEMVTLKKSLNIIKSKYPTSDYMKLEKGIPTVILI